MSWFDTSGFANLAKTALKEAQKTIDKALDIKDEEQKPSSTQSLSTSSDFFNSWGVEEEDKEEKESCIGQKQLNTSIWGSFTGSFFENSKEDMIAITTKSIQPFNDSSESTDKFESFLIFSKSFPERLSSRTAKEILKDSAMVQSTTNLDMVPNSTSNSENLEGFVCKSSTIENACKKQSSLLKFQDPSIATDNTSSRINSCEKKPNIEEINESNIKIAVSPRKKEHNTSYSIHRLSILSAESDKKSSESVEILSNTSTDCTNSPDSDVNSLSASVGLKVNSDSVEVLPDSLVTSPSSVEVLNDWKSDESPYLSPVDEKLFDSSITSIPDDTRSSRNISEGLQPTILKTSINISHMFTSSTNLISPLENVEMITTDVDDVDEISLADSYTSASESTTLMTIVETQHKDKIIHDSCTDSDQIMSVNSESDYSLNLNLDSLKEKNSLASLHQSIEAITRQPIRKLDYSDTAKKLSDLNNPFECLKFSTIQQADVKNSKPENSECSSSSEQYLLLTDSSCEETLVESGSEENNISVTHHPPLTSSSYVKNMLADAMEEKYEITESERQEVPRENSPISSESRSDLVKIGSNQTSGHTSGDELETTTSSDIEIISSPNGDSSSTQSRQSPAKLQSCKSVDLLTRTLKTRGHSRELSEISVGSDDSSLEIERLLRRIREMTEILEAREAKLIEASRINMELHEQNSSLKKQLDSVEKHVEHNQDITQITDDYTQRLSALERKFQQAIRERDALRKSTEQLKQEAALRPSIAEIFHMNAEKDEIIKELREEGEKLSKQQLQHNNIIKKLRVKDKENEASIKSQKEQLEEQIIELERLKRSLYAKEEVERIQIEAVYSLTSKCKTQEKEILSLSEQLDHIINKMEAYKKSFEAAKAELLETKEKLNNVEKELKLTTENAGQMHQLLFQEENLKVKLRQAEETHIKKEKLLKQENAELLKRLETAESRNEEMSESVSQATKPLLRQLEQLQLNLSHKTNIYIRQEEIMNEKIANLQTKLDMFSETNRSLAEENAKLKSKYSVSETKLNSKEKDHKRFEEFYESLKEENKKLCEKNEVHKQAMKMLEEAHATEIKELKKEISALENRISMEKAATEAEKRKNHTVLEQQSLDEELRFSPSLSIERDSVSSANSVWLPFNDAVFETGSGKFSNVYDSFKSGTNSTSIFENLQAQVKLRDGEIQHLQWELSRRNMERDALNNEVSLLASKVEDLSSMMTEMDVIRENLNDTQTKYDALLQMYGEKVEENQELRLDLQDIKEMYKTQIDQLLKRDL